MNVTIMALIVIGGIGFMTWDDVKTNRLHLRRYRMQSKVVLSATAALIILPAIYFFFLEFDGAPMRERVWLALFQSVTPRTAGFNTADLTALSEDGLALTILLMLVGGSHGSTARGMKTTTMALLLANAAAVFRRREHAHFFGRRVDGEAVRSAVTVAVLPYVTNAQIGDATNGEFLSSLGVRNYDACIVAIGDNFQNSLETASLLKELGAKKVIARASTGVQEKFLLRNGADEVVYPEKQLAAWTAIRCTSEHILDYIELDGDWSLFELDIPPAWQGKTVVQLDIRKKYGINVLGVREKGRLNMNVTADTVLDQGKLTPIEYKLLSLLAQNTGKVLTHKFILQHVWGGDWESNVGSLRVYMASPRKKLEGASGSPQYIQTHIGIGYRMLKVEDAL